MGAEMSQFFWIALTVAMLLGIIGLYCLLVSTNMMRIIIGLEVMTKAVVLLLAVVGKITGFTALTQSYIITIIVVEAVVIAVAAGIVVCTFKQQGSLDVRGLRKLNG